MSNVGYATLTVIPSAKGFGKALDSDVSPQLGASGDKAGKSMGGKAVGALGGVLKKGALFVGGAAGGILTTALFKGWNRLTAIEDAEAKLKGLGHSTSSVKQIMDNALASVKGTAFGLGDAATVAAGVVASGVKPGKDLERTLRLVGDAATIAGADMGEMGSIFNKVAASGKLQGDVIAQLGDRGIPILQLLGKEIGKTPAEVAKLASQGKIDFATFQNAMEKGLGGAALKSGETTKGAFANMQAALGRFGAELLKNVFPIAKVVFGGLTGLIDTGTNAIKPFVSWVAGPLVQGIKGLFSLFSSGDFTPDLRKSMGLEEDSAIVDTLFNIRDTFLAAFGAIKNFIMVEVVPRFTAIWQAIQGFVAVALPIVQGFVTGMMARIAPLMPTVREIFSTIGTIITTALDGIKAVIERVTAVISWIWANWGQTIMNHVTVVFKAVLNVIKPALATIQAVIKTVVAIIKGDWSGAWNGIKAIFSGVWDTIKALLSGALSIIKSTIGSYLSMVGSLWSAAWEAVKSKIASVFVSIVTTVATKIGSVVQTIRELPGKAVSALGNLGGTLVSAGSDLIGGFIRGIVRKAGDLVATIRNTITDKLPDFVKKALGIHSPSRVFMALGEFTAEGMALGLANGAKGVQRAADALLPSADYTLAAGITPGAGAAAAAVTSITVQIAPKDLDGLRSIERFVAMARQQSRQMNGVTL